MKITLAEQLHADKLQIIVKETFHFACPQDSNRDLQAKYIAKQLSSNHFRKIIGSNDNKVWVALDGSEPIGFAVLEKLSDDTALLSKLYVLSEFQGKGAAMKLADKVVGYAKDFGYKKITLSVYSGNLKAKSFYERQGFRFVNECDFVMETEIHKDHIYELSIV